jgi:hypothetical protein
MAENNTAQTLVNVGSWLQIPFSLLQIALGVWLLWLMFPVLVDPVFWTIFGWWTVLLLGFIIVGGVLGIILAILWFRWRKDVPTHKKGFIASSIIGMIISGGVPGLLVLIGAAIYPIDKA